MLGTAENGQWGSVKRCSRGVDADGALHAIVHVPRATKLLPRVLKSSSPKVTQARLQVVGTYES